MMTDTLPNIPFITRNQLQMNGLAKPALANHNRLACNPWSPKEMSQYTVNTYTRAQNPNRSLMNNTVQSRHKAQVITDKRPSTAAPCHLQIPLANKTTAHKKRGAKKC